MLSPPPRRRRASSRWRGRRRSVRRRRSRRARRRRPSSRGCSSCGLPAGDVRRDESRLRGHVAEVHRDRRQRRLDRLDVPGRSRGTRHPRLGAGSRAADRDARRASACSRRGGPPWNTLPPKSAAPPIASELLMTSAMDGPGRAAAPRRARARPRRARPGRRGRWRGRGAGRVARSHASAARRRSRRPPSRAPRARASRSRPAPRPGSAGARPPGSWSSAVD